MKEFGPWSVSRGILEVNEASPFWPINLFPLTSLVPQLNHGLSHSESVVSLCHPLVCMNGCVFLSGVECTVQWYSAGSVFLLLGIILFGYCRSDFLFSSLFLFSFPISVFSLTPAMSWLYCISESRAVTQCAHRLVGLLNVRPGLSLCPAVSHIWSM